MTLPRDRKPLRPDVKQEMSLAKTPQGSKGERAFDAWLKQGLHKLYDDIASEPIPDALLKMIEQDRHK